MDQQQPIVGAVEAGGTKVVCALGRGPGTGILARTQLATGDDPRSLLARVIEWFGSESRLHGVPSAFGVASFGPLDLDPASPRHGFITTTPKPGWRGTDLLGPIRAAFPGRPIGLDTDVNGAALGEARWGAARGLEDFVYVTVGTGIGGGGVARGRPLHGLVHPEMGHIPMPVLDGDAFPGTCRVHGRCWEGLCAGPAIAARADRPAEELAADDPAWDLTIRYMAQALATLTLVLSPRRIIVGGSVRKAGRLGEAAFFARLRSALLESLGGYVDSPSLRPGGIDAYVVPPALGDDAGILGAMALAQDAIGLPGTAAAVRD